jgi:putative phosphoribosyl transferase
MTSEAIFANRAEAGRAVARELEQLRDEDVVVVGLPRGGIPVAFEVARALGAPLDVVVVRKLGAPQQPELGVGAVAEQSLVIDEGIATRAGILDDELTHAAAEKKQHVDEDVRLYRGGAPPLDVRGKTVIVVDDGIATGGTARAAIRTLRQRGARRIVLAVPVGPAETVDDLRSEADEVVCVFPKEWFLAVGLWYEDFASTTDEEVIRLLDRAHSEHGEAAAAPRRPPLVLEARNVHMPFGEGTLEGRLTIPAHARGLVLFAHGSGSSRSSTRNRFVAGELEHAGIATLLFDLLTREEERVDARSAHLRFDIELLASRLITATDWVEQQRDAHALPIGYFGASTGAAAALLAAVFRPRAVHAIVSRGGRPDLAGEVLHRVQAPTLLLVGSDDGGVLRLNREALAKLRAPKELELIPGATHLFEEPGALERVAHAASRWFVRHLFEHATRASA